MTLLRRLAFISLIFVTSLPAQRRVDPRNNFYRVIAVVPYVAGPPGTASWPKHVPTTPPAGPSASAGIIAFACEPSDDGKHAIVELVGVNRAALADVLADHAAGVLVFEKSSVPWPQIEAAIQPFRKDFSLSKFGVAVQ